MDASAGVAEMIAAIRRVRPKEIALLKLEGYTNEEIAEKLECSPRSVTRRLTLIRRLWEKDENP